MKIVNIGLNHKTAPLSIREKLSFSDAQMEKFYDLLNLCDVIEESLILSTCNRVEIYAVGVDAGDILSILKDFLYLSHDVPFGSIDEFLYHSSENEAIEHLCQVASGLDSCIIGEAEILGQIKRAYNQANAFNAIGPYLHKALQDAIHIGKKVRTATNISKGVTSLSGAAVELIKKDKQLDAKTALVIGAGKIGSLTVKKLIQMPLKKIILINRDLSKADAMKDSDRLRPSSFKNLENDVCAADIVITATSADMHIITKEMLDKKERLLIDLGVPRNIDEKVGDLANVRLFNVDDLGSTIEETLRLRSAEAKKAHDIIENALCVKSYSE